MTLSNKILRMAINKRKRIIDEVDQAQEGGDEAQDSEEGEESAAKKDAPQKYLKPSDEARQMISDDGM